MRVRVAIVSSDKVSVVGRDYRVRRTLDEHVSKLSSVLCRGTTDLHDFFPTPLTNARAA